MAHFKPYGYFPYQRAEEDLYGFQYNDKLELVSCYTSRTVQLQNEGLCRYSNHIKDMIPVISMQRLVETIG